MSIIKIGKDDCPHSKMKSILVRKISIIILLSLIHVTDVSAYNINNITVGASPLGVAVNQNTNMIYVANLFSNTIAVIDGSTNMVVENIEVGDFPNALAVNPYTNRIYVTNLNSGSITVIDGSTNSIVTNITVEDLPYRVAVNPTSNRVYVANSNSLSIIDGLTNEIVFSISLGDLSGLAINSNTNIIYVSNSDSDFDSGSVAVIDGLTNDIIADMILDNPVEIAINQNTSMVYVINSSSVAVINGSTNNISYYIPVGTSPAGIAVNPNTNIVYVTDSDLNSVIVINGSTNEIINNIPVGASPSGIAINSNTNVLYVANSDSDSLSVIGASEANRTPYISFTDPTPENSAILFQNYAYINTTVIGASTAFIDWNSSLAGWWRFNNESGENTTFFKDWSKGRNDATCVGKNCPVSASGKFGKSLNFDGKNDFLDAGKKANQNIKGALTIEAWINPAVPQEKCWDGVSGNYGVMSKVSSPENSSNWNWQLRYGAPDSCYLGFQFNGNPEKNRWITAKKNLTAGKWYHIAGIFDGKEIKFYLNGKLRDKNKISSIKRYRNKLLIGNDGWGNNFKGKIDEIRIHRRVLSPGEIKASYDAGIHKLGRNFTTLPKGVYNYQAYAQDPGGNVNQTEKRNLTLVSTLPSVRQ